MKYIHKLIYALIIISIVLISGCTKSTKAKGGMSKHPFLVDCNEAETAQNRENCYKDIAIKQKDIELCEEITVFENVRNLCYQQIAIDKKDHLLCNKIQGDDWRKNICLTKTKK